MRCRKCWAEVPEDARFCPRCGVQLHVEQATKVHGNDTGSVFGQRFDPAYLHHRFGKTEYRFALVIRESESKTWACSSGG